MFACFKFYFSVSNMTEEVVDEVVEVVAEVVEIAESSRLLLVEAASDVALTVEAVGVFIVETITFLVNLVLEIFQFIIGKRH